MEKKKYEKPTCKVVLMQKPRLLQASGDMNAYWDANEVDA